MNDSEHKGKDRLTLLKKLVVQWFEANEVELAYNYLMDVLMETTDNENLVYDNEWQKIKGLLLHDNETNQHLGIELLKSQYSEQLGNRFTKIFATPDYQHCALLINTLAEVANDKQELIRFLKETQAELGQLKRDNASPEAIQALETKLKQSMPQDSLEYQRERVREYKLRKHCHQLAEKILEIKGLIKTQEM